MYLFLQNGSVVINKNSAERRNERTGKPSAHFGVRQTGGDWKMTTNTPVSWLEVVKLIVSIVSATTPIVLFFVGRLLLRQIEGVKTAVASQSDFRKKWAEEFFGCCQRFMQALERQLALLTVRCRGTGAAEKFGADVKDEIDRLVPTLSELELRIRRCVVFAPMSGSSASKAASDCIALTGKLLEERKGNVDEIIGKMNEFNRASREAHAEMLGLEAAEHGVASVDRPRTATRR